MDFKGLSQLYKTYLETDFNMLTAKGNKDSQISEDGIAAGISKKLKEEKKKKKISHCWGHRYSYL